MEDAGDSKSSVRKGRVGSNPITRTKLREFNLGVMYHDGHHYVQGLRMSISPYMLAF